MNHHLVCLWVTMDQEHDSRKQASAGNWGTCYLFSWEYPPSSSTTLGSWALEEFYILLSLALSVLKGLLSTHNLNVIPSECLSLRILVASLMIFSLGCDLSECKDFSIIFFILFHYCIPSIRDYPWHIIGRLNKCLLKKWMNKWVDG